MDTTPDESNQSRTYIASTSFGKLWRLTLTASGGGHNLTFHRFGRHQSGLSLARILPGLWATPKLLPQSGYVNSVALGQIAADGMIQDILAIVDWRIQRWNSSFEGWEELLVDNSCAPHLTGGSSLS